MNVKLHHVVTDMTGLVILDAIVAGERDPKVLATATIDARRARPRLPKPCLGDQMT